MSLSYSGGRFYRDACQLREGDVLVLGQQTGVVMYREVLAGGDIQATFARFGRFSSALHRVGTLVYAPRERVEIRPPSLQDLAVAMRDLADTLGRGLQ